MQSSIRPSYGEFFGTIDEICCKWILALIWFQARIGLVSNTSYENKKLAVDLAELVIKWENQRIKESQQKGDSMFLIKFYILVFHYLMLYY